MKRLVFVAILAIAAAAGCCPLRHYKFAKHDPHDSSAGDITHVSEPGARVIVPKHSKN